MKLTTLKPRLATLRTSSLQPLQADRLRGRKAVKRRASFLDLNPLCADCTKAGMVSAAAVPDHVVPLWAGGADDLEQNGQALCHEHHDAKTACEARMRAAGGWLATACICGQHQDASTRASAAPAPA